MVLSLLSHLQRILCLGRWPVESKPLSVAQVRRANRRVCSYWQSNGHRRLSDQQTGRDQPGRIVPRKPPRRFFRRGAGFRPMAARLLDKLRRRRDPVPFLVGKDGQHVNGHGKAATGSHILSSRVTVNITTVKSPTRIHLRFPEQPKRKHPGGFEHGPASHDPWLMLKFHEDIEAGILGCRLRLKHPCTAAKSLTREKQWSDFLKQMPAERICRSRQSWPVQQKWCASSSANWFSW